MPPRSRVRSRTAFSLIELMCVIAIIAVLMSMMAYPMFKALRKARNLVGEVEHEDVHLEKIRKAYSAYRLRSPTHPELNRDKFIEVCALNGKTREWMRSPDLTFRPFSGSTAPNTVVIEWHYTLSKPPVIRHFTVLDLLRTQPQE